MSIAMPLVFNIDKSAPLVTRLQETLLQEGDDRANEIIIGLHDGGKEISLSGYAASAEMQRYDGKKVPCDCVISKTNAVTVQLNAHCYAVPGAYTLCVRLTNTETGAKRTVLRLVGRVVGEGDGAIVNVEQYIPNLDDLLDEIETMREATAEAKAAAEEASAWADMTPVAETLAPGNEATIRVEEDADGRRTIIYGIPISPYGAAYRRVPFALTTAAIWTETIEGLYETDVDVADMPDANGDVYLDVTDIPIGSAEAYRAEYQKIWTARTYAGGVNIKALSIPTMDLRLVAGVYVWVP